MANHWTDEQQAAIDSRNQNLLLSAAAGSGKTAVLVARIISRLTDRENPVDADKLLVVTFTNAAAAEMRERIINALTALTEENPEDPFFANQLLLAKKAQITTIDSFCIDILRQNFVVANISPDFRIADPTENAVMRDEVLDDVLNEMYDDTVYAEDFFKLLESYANSKANDKSFRELIHSLFLFASSLPNPVEWLNNSAENFNKSTSFENTLWCEKIVDEAKLELLKCISEYDRMISLTKDDMFESYERFLIEERRQFIDAAEKETYDELRKTVEMITFGTRPRTPKDLFPKYADTVNSMRDKIKKKHIALLREKILSITADEQAEAIYNSYPIMRCLSETVIRLRDKFMSKKMEKNILDFNDCEHLCLKILTNQDGSPSDTAIEIQKKYDEIYIDEYQDTSKLQEAIFSAIKRENNLFMVGDIKQSIYRFRNTDPSLFKYKCDTFSSECDSENRKIILSKNFRSRENVLSSINYIFERIMSEQTGEINYNDSEKLYMGAVFPNDAICPLNSDTEVCILDVPAIIETDVESDIYDSETIELEALYVANRISSLIESGEQVFVNGSYRPVKFSDICIISRKKDVSPVLSSALSEMGIPCFCENTGKFLNSSEIMIAISMLSVIDNPLQDLPLLSVLRSVMFGFSADTLAKIRCCDKNVSFYEAMKKCAEQNFPESKSAHEAVEFIEEFIYKSKYMRVSELIQDIYNKTGFYDAQQTQPNGIIRRANLRLLYNRAKEYEKTGLKGLYNFIRFINDYKAFGGDYDAAKIIGTEQDAVRIMSIHKSKGLEFPIVIMFNIERQFNLTDLTKSVLYHADLGFGPKYVDTQLRITYPFAPRVAMESILKAECIAEEMRILYVAMTRAKEKLILVGSVSDMQKKINSFIDCGKTKTIPPAIVSECKSYMDWILLALINHPNCDILRKMCDANRWIYNDESRFSINIIRDKKMLFNGHAFENCKEDEQKENLTHITPLVSYVYPNIDDTVLPTKITVTELKRREQNVDEQGSAYLFKPEKMLNIPSNKLTGTQIGIAYHTVMQHIKLSDSLNTREDISKQIFKIKEDGFLTDEEAGAVNPEKILKFFKSGTGKIVLEAKEVRREIMFGILEPASKLSTEFKNNKDIMLQGIIDCVVETDDGLFIIDYKTDKIFRPEDTVEKYKIQLECYKMAAEKIFKKKVISKILYLFDSDMGITF